MSCNPIALAMYKTPAECGADIAVGEGQPLGMPIAFGGPVSRLYGGEIRYGKKAPRQDRGRNGG